MQRHYLLGLIIGLLSMAWSSPLLAQEFPAKQIRIISPYGPGGGNDTIARLLATKLSVVFNQRVIVENKPGANTIIGNDMVAKAPPDGHTLIVNGTGFITNPSFYAKMPFDSLKDFTPVAFIAFTELALVVNTALPAQSVKEIIALAKAKPATLNFGNTGLGGSEHLAGVLFGQLGGVDIGSIPYKGAAAAITDLLGGQVQLMITALAAVKPHIQSGQLRLVAMADTGRSPQYPNVPTVVESGLAGFQTAMWYGVMAPAGMPEGVLKKLNQTINQVLRERDMLDNFTSRGLTLGDEAQYGTPELFGAFVKSEIANTNNIARAAGITPE
jgi:tripartite-type tricarboxylate transporter receptor subunit TctC